jgi:protein-L-isoaspartate(D-aspartate) O-methyltransferase
MTDQVTAGGGTLIQRNLMVDAQVRPNNVNDRRVIEAMRALPREAFAPAGSLPYSDADIPLGNGRYMLAPMTIARLAQLVLADNPATVLVIAAGSGYGAAILAAGGAQVVALEEDAALATGALARFAPTVESVRGPLAKGWPAAGPYDAILIEGAVTAIPDILAAQLVPAGRVVAILAEPGPAGLGRAVVAAPSSGGFAVVKKFDCAARLLPAFRPAPAFSF